MYHLMNQPLLTTMNSLGVYIRDIDSNVQRAIIILTNTGEIKEVDLYVHDTSCALFDNLESGKTYDFLAQVMVNDIWETVSMTTFKTLLTDIIPQRFNPDSPPPSISSESIQMVEILPDTDDIDLDNVINTSEKIEGV